MAPRSRRRTARSDVLVVDLQDIGTRTWTYVDAMLYTMRAAARHHIPVMVLDRPDPLSGVTVHGPLLVPSLANPEEHRAARPARAYALYPAPLWHGITMGALALRFSRVLDAGRYAGDAAECASPARRARRAERLHAARTR